MKTEVPVWGWVGLGIPVLVLLVIDLVGHRGNRGTSRRAAFIWTGV
jgi:tellurite resistance protein TerC